MFELIEDDFLQLLRQNEDTFKTKELSRQNVFDTLFNHPSLLQRPIFMSESFIVIARPPELLNHYL